MQFTTVRSKEKDYDIYLKSEKLVHSQQEHEKNVSHLFGSGKNWFLAILSLTNTVSAIWKWEKEKVVPSYFEPDKHCCSYLERDKSRSLLFGDQKMYFTTVRRKEKDYDIYLKSEKLVHSQQEHEKNVSQLFGSRFTPISKNWFTFGDQKIQFTTVRRKEKDYYIYLKSEKLVPISSLSNTVAAIWREIKVDPCYLETKKFSSQLLGERKKIITSI